MRNRFEQELEKLNAELIEMGALCEESMNYAIRALFDKETDLIERAEESEKTIDRMEREIEGLCMRLLLQQQPVAGDLRMISSALKMISDMERIGDQAEDIAEIVKYMADREIPNPQHLKNMASYAMAMLTGSINAFVERDAEKARKVITDDDAVDDLFAKVKEDLIDSIGTSAKTGREEEQFCREEGQFLLDILMIAKYIERVGDHATNIAEWVIYGLTGSRPEEKN